MKTKIIGVDFDDVIGNLVSTWLDNYNRDNDDNLSEKDIKSWDIGLYTKIGKEIYDYLKHPSLYDDVKPVLNSFFGVSSLINMGYRVVFITASTTEQSGRKYTWLSENGYINSKSDYYEAVDKSLIATDYLIDDNPENVINAYGQGVVYTREWNKSLIGYPRVNNWMEVINFFSKIGA